VQRWNEERSYFEAVPYHSGDLWGPNVRGVIQKTLGDQAHDPVGHQVAAVPYQGCTGPIFAEDLADTFHVSVYPAGAVERPLVVRALNVGFTM
jgi:hypothetical protein